MFSALPVLTVYKGNAANAAASVFPVAHNGQPIRFVESHDIKAAKLTIATGAVSPLVEGVDYAISGGPLAGALTLLAGPLGNGYELAIYRQETFEQPYKLTLPVIPAPESWMTPFSAPYRMPAPLQTSWGG